jgi:Holliday junction resolvase RusA-like endonuclease
MKIEFTVFAEAVPQGSKRAFVRGNRAYVVNVKDKQLKDWRQQVAQEALSVLPEGFELMLGPAYLEVLFIRPRPASHFGTGRNAGTVKASAPSFPTTRPDTLKLARSVEDALTGIVWRDDSQVVEHRMRKIWGDRHEVVVCIKAL